MNTIPRFFAVLTLITALAPVTARADQPGKHPAYLHALTDLRTARAHIEKRGGDAEMKWDEQTAIREIDAAIGEIKKASIDDGKNLNDHPPVDEKKDRAGRLHRALELLRKAKKDIREKEDNNFAEGLRDRAAGHIEAAENFVEQGIANSKK
jgi:hypothetical protein